MAKWTIDFSKKTNIFNTKIYFRFTYTIYSVAHWKSCSSFLLKDLSFLEESIAHYIALVCSGWQFELRFRLIWWLDIRGHLQQKMFCVWVNGTHRLNLWLPLKSQVLPYQFDCIDCLCFVKHYCLNVPFDSNSGSELENVIALDKSVIHQVSCPWEQRMLSGFRIVY